MLKYEIPAALAGTAEPVVFSADDTVSQAQGTVFGFARGKDTGKIYFVTVTVEEFVASKSVASDKSVASEATV